MRSIDPKRSAIRDMAILGLSLAAAACGGDESAVRETAEDGATGSPTPSPTCGALLAVAEDSLATTESGLRTRVLRGGEGHPAAAGDTVTAHYLGCLVDGTRFDASYDRAEPISFVLGRGRVIAGWDEGLRGMRPGEVRVLRIPPDLAYGARGTPGGPIPPDATLLFQVELEGIQPAGPPSSDSPGS